MDIEVPETDAADALAERWVDLAAGQRRHGSHVLPTDNRRRIREDVFRHLVRDSLLVASVDGEVRGFVMFSLEEGSFDLDVTRGIVENLFVSPEARNEGIGGALLEAAETALAERGADVVALEVLAANADARRFYDRQGYEPHRIELEKAVEDGPTQAESDDGPD